MGLDMMLHKIQSLSILDSGGFNDWGEEIKYWRKYYALNKWFIANCKRLDNDIIDGCVVDKENMKELLCEAKKQLNGDINEKYDLREDMEYLSDLIVFIEEFLQSDDGYEYYFQYVP